MSDSKTDKKQGFIESVGKWFREMRSELRKVVWPTPRQVINNTGVVIAMVLVVGMFIWLVDAGLLWCLNTLLTFAK